MLKGSVPVLAFDQDNTHQLATGTLLLIDNQIDQTTSTIRLKASFPNEDARLWPGEFVRVRVLVDTLKNVVTVPLGRGSAQLPGSVRLGDRSRRHGGEPADLGRPERRRRDRGDQRLASRRARRRQRPIPLAGRGQGRRHRRRKSRSRRSSHHEYFRALRSPADRHVAADDGDRAAAGSWRSACCRWRLCRRSTFRPSAFRRPCPARAPKPWRRPSPSRSNGNSDRSPASRR